MTLQMQIHGLCLFYNFLSNTYTIVHKRSYMRNYLHFAICLQPLILLHTQLGLSFLQQHTPTNKDMLQFGRSVYRSVLYFLHDNTKPKDISFSPPNRIYMAPLYTLFPQIFFLLVSALAKYFRMLL